MKNKIARPLIRTCILLGVASLLALPLQAARGGNGGGGNAGECPQGFEPGTRAQQERVRPQDGTGSQYRNKSGKGAKQECDGTGQGRKQGRGNGQGTGNPEDCPYNTD